MDRAVWCANTSDLCEPLTIVLGSLSNCPQHVYSTHTVHMNVQSGHIGVCCEVHPCGVVTTQTWVCAPFQHRTCTPEMSPLYSHTTDVQMLIID